MVEEYGQDLSVAVADSCCTVMNLQVLKRC
jgi:hypothetical protein